MDVPPITTLDPILEPEFGSPPPLYYPEDVEIDELAGDDEPMTDVPPLNLDGDLATKPPPDPQNRTGKQDAPSTALVVASETPKNPVQVLVRLRKNVELITPYIDQLILEERDEEVFECLANLGLLQIVYEMGEAKRRGDPDKKGYWTERMAKILEEREEEVEAFIAKNKRRMETVIDKTAAPPYTPVEKVPEEPTYVPKSPADGKMEEPRYVPESPDPAKEAPVKPESAEPKAWDEINLQIADLEKTVTDTTDNLWTRLKELENQVYADGCLLTELNWRSNEWKKWEKKRWHEEKKANHKNGQKGGPRYHTRSVTAASEEKVAEVRKNLSKLTDQSRALEVKIEVVSAEIKSIKSQIKCLSLMRPDLEAISKDFEDFRKAQADLNSVFMSEIATIKLSLGPNVESQLKHHASQLATLTSQQYQLYHVTMNMLYPDYAKPSNSKHATQNPSNSFTNPRTTAVF